MFQIPERSGLPSGVLGAGAERFGFPSGVRGIPGVGWRSHCAKSETLVEIKIAKTKTGRATLASSCRKADWKFGRISGTNFGDARRILELQNSGCVPEIPLFREGIRPGLELHDLLPCPLAAFLVPGCIHRVARPEAAAFPAGMRIVDSS